MTLYIMYMYMHVAYNFKGGNTAMGVRGEGGGGEDPPLGPIDVEKHSGYTTCTRVYTSSYTHCACTHTQTLCY